MNVPILGRLLDERFFTYRRRSTSTAGIVTGMAATLLWAYRYFFDHIWSWDLLAIALTFVGIKMALMTWYYLTD
jgi:hypothetical protein